VGTHKSSEIASIIDDLDRATIKRGDLVKHEYEVICARVADDSAVHRWLRTGVGLVVEDNAAAESYPRCAHYYGDVDRYRRYDQKKQRYFVRVFWSESQTSVVHCINELTRISEYDQAKTKI
jgi:hypothetical protein